MQGQRSTY